MSEQGQPEVRIGAMSGHARVLIRLQEPNTSTPERGDEKSSNDRPVEVGKDEGNGR